MKNEYIYEDETIIIDKTTIESYKKINNDLELPKIIKKNNNFIIYLFTVNPSKGNFIKYEILISRKGKILDFSEKFIEDK